MSRNYQSSVTEVILDQQRYSSEQPVHQDPARWWIPYNLVTSSQANFDETTATHWLPPTAGSQTINVANLSASDWLIVNKQVCSRCIIL